MKITNEKLKQLLVQPGHISDIDFNISIKESEEKKIPIERLLVEKGLMPDEYLGRTIADGTGYRFVNLETVSITNNLLGFIPEIVARSQQVIVFGKDGKTIKLATLHPDNYEFIKLLERKTGFQIEVYYTTPLGIKEALSYYKSDLGTEVQNLINEIEESGQAKISSMKSEQNIVKLVNLFLEYAHDNKASDIHLEPLEDEISVRFRVDGILHEVVTYPQSLHSKITFKIKNHGSSAY